MREIKEIKTGKIITEGIAADNLNKPACAIGDVFISFKIAVILYCGVRVAFKSVSFKFNTALYQSGLM